MQASIPFPSHFMSCTGVSNSCEYTP
jgi:hypothetical protein